MRILGFIFRNERSSNILYANETWRIAMGDKRKKKNKSGRSRSEPTASNPVISLLLLFTARVSDLIIVHHQVFIIYIIIGKFR